MTDTGVYVQTIFYNILPLYATILARKTIGRLASIASIAYTQRCFFSPFLDNIPNKFSATKWRVLWDCKAAV